MGKRGYTSSRNHVLSLTLPLHQPEVDVPLPAAGLRVVPVAGPVALAVGARAQPRRDLLRF